MGRRGDRLQRQSWLSCGDSGAAVVGDFRGACKIVPDCLGFWKRAKRGNKPTSQRGNPPNDPTSSEPEHRCIRCTSPARASLFFAFFICISSPTGTESSANGVLHENHVFTVANLSEYPRFSLRLVVRPEYLSSSSPKALQTAFIPVAIDEPADQASWYHLGHLVPTRYSLRTAPHAMTSRLEPCPVRCRCLLPIFGLSPDFVVFSSWGRLIYPGVDHGSMLREALAGKLRQQQTLELFSFLLPFFSIFAVFNKASAADLPSHRRSRCRGTDYSRLLKATRGYPRLLKDYSGY
ncbi:predicted protein [Aspergillus nidulans FGSC A4]|uniref:Uncharacterized protein n=1 Tax=Emericella nidulans (strain FGSC A4 / ATCC 38163 / CBS 112.46 / NRRL 194 / M139) TaxID=227321 RepID=Q5AWT3_EMENI|nr:hypothetical protein [Aspergillus nidulans FGSC A4]EAA61294.1 predicted protein [Aspergillus nidulans FGSC A4]CBF78775.1 TPA: conserved hypothetical protein [Aspergillus nidulans FGSC A4]|eukprot:XP_680516.1 predicted protein [Aspergillus nidulans FGSC A4]